MPSPIDMRPSFLPILLATAIGCTGCLPWLGAVYPFPGTFGTTSQGLLKGGRTLPRQGENFRLYHASKKAFAVPQLVRALVRAADKVEKAHNGSMLLIGDMSSAHGGFLPGHSSHRSGRDADTAFFTTDLWGASVVENGLIHFDRFGVGLRDNRIRKFDTARNWSLVEALINDEEIEVQWIFVSAGLKALLLEWALENGKDLQTVERAAVVLKQPGDSAPHDDHFHIRIYCPKDRFGALCLDTPPFRPWVQKPSAPSGPTRETLLRAALEGIE
jgi:penicillin-insensitive murein DD-endopeptidase